MSRLAPALAKREQMIRTFSRDYAIPAQAMCIYAILKDDLPDKVKSRVLVKDGNYTIDTHTINRIVKAYCILHGYMHYQKVYHTKEACHKTRRKRLLASDIQVGPSTFLSVAPETSAPSEYYTFKPTPKLFLDGHAEYGITGTTIYYQKAFIVAALTHYVNTPSDTYDPHLTGKALEDFFNAYTSL